MTNASQLLHRTTAEVDISILSSNNTQIPHQRASWTDQQIFNDISLETCLNILNLIQITDCFKIISLLILMYHYPCANHHDQIYSGKLSIGLLFFLLSFCLLRINCVFIVKLISDPAIQIHDQFF